MEGFPKFSQKAVLDAFQKRIPSDFRAFKMVQGFVKGSKGSQRGSCDPTEVICEGNQGILVRTLYWLEWGSKSFFGCSIDSSQALLQGSLRSL